MWRFRPDYRHLSARTERELTVTSVQEEQKEAYNPLGYGLFSQRMVNSVFIHRSDSYSPFGTGKSTPYRITVGLEQKGTRNNSYFSPKRAEMSLIPAQDLR